MLFNSIEYLILLIITLIFYYLFDLNKYQKIILLVASIIFYLYFKPILIFILLISIILNYYFAILIQKSRNKNFIIKIGIIINLLILIYFKYLNFILSSFVELISSFNINKYQYHDINIILPLGLSFHTFQSISYLIEVYKNKFKAETKIENVAIFILFFPQIIAGPIERPKNILHQFKESHKFQIDNFIEGLVLLLRGFFKKIVIADRLASYINVVYDNPNEHNSTTIIFTVFLFSFQIYSDFSGYTDIARGSGKLLNIDLIENFNFPYLSSSMSDFWKRWHISLSTWFRDYLYIPIGGNRKNVIRNLLIVFLLSGLWHGASWTFIIWGGVHGLLLIIEKIIKPICKKIPKVITIPTTFIITSLTWIFFRSENLLKVKIIFNKLLLLNFRDKISFLKFGPFNFYLMLFSLSIWLCISFIKPSNRKGKMIFATILSLIIILLGINEKSNFIYYQF